MMLLILVFWAHGRGVTPLPRAAPPQKPSWCSSELGACERDDSSMLYSRLVERLECEICIYFDLARDDRFSRKFLVF